MKIKQAKKPLAQNRTYPWKVSGGATR